MLDMCHEGGEEFMKQITNVVIFVLIGLLFLVTFGLSREIDRMKERLVSTTIQQYEINEKQMEINGLMSEGLMESAQLSAEIVNVLKQ
jgi:hypothetical protein